jgi:hypothetical protein
MSIKSEPLAPDPDNTGVGMELSISMQKPMAFAAYPVNRALFNFEFWKRPNENHHITFWHIA